MLTARATTLRADRAYIDLLEAESTWAFKYNLSRTNPVDPRALPMWAKTPGVLNVNGYNSLLPINFRMQTRASQNRPQTQLFGTAPYTALGRGLLHHVDTNSQLQQSNWVAARGSRQGTTEAELRRFDFVTLPRELTTMPFESRYGAMTRVGPAYAQPHD
jgi:hypothetical protein